LTLLRKAAKYFREWWTTLFIALHRTRITAFKHGDFSVFHIP